MRPVQLESSGAQDAPTHHDDFEDVFRAHHDRLVRLAGLLCGNAAVAEDAVAEVFARLYRRWHPGTIEDVDAYLRRAGGRRPVARPATTARRRSPPPGDQGTTRRTTAPGAACSCGKNGRIPPVFAA